MAFPAGMHTIYFFAFPFQFWPQLTTATGPGQAGPVAAASPVFLFTGQPGQSLATSRAHPGFQAGFDPGLPRSGGVPDARVYHVRVHVYQFPDNISW